MIFKDLKEHAVLEKIFGAECRILYCWFLVANIFTKQFGKKEVNDIANQMMLAQTVTQFEQLKNNILQQLPIVTQNISKKLAELSPNVSEGLLCQCDITQKRKEQYSRDNERQIKTIHQEVVIGFMRDRLAILHRLLRTKAQIQVVLR